MAQFIDTTTRNISSLEYGKQYVFTEWGKFDENDYPLDLQVLTSSTTVNKPYPGDGYLILAMIFMNVSDLQNESWDHSWDFDYERGYYTYFDYYLSYSGNEDKGIGADAGTIPSSFNTFRDYIMGQKYWIRMRRDSIDGYLYVKVWKENEEEPAEWKGIYPDSYSDNSGYIAIGIGYSGNWQFDEYNNATFYRVALGTKGDPPPLGSKISAKTTFKVILRKSNKMYGYADTSGYCRIITPFFAWGKTETKFNVNINPLKWMCFHPTSIIQKTNLSGTILDIQSNPYEDNLNWLEVINQEENINAFVKFSIIDKTIYDGDTDNIFYILLRKNTIDGKKPIVQFSIFEDGSEIKRSKKMMVVDTDGKVVKFRFKAYELEKLELPTITLKITGISHGFDTSKRNVDIGAVKWCGYFLC